jgi:GWxTD domain-containing protein
MLPYRSHTHRAAWPLAAAIYLACSSTAREQAATHVALGDAGARESTRDDEDAQQAVDAGRSYRDRNTIHGRLLSQRVLEAARADHPDDIEVTMELAKTYFAQGFYPDAVRIFRDVLARDPGRCDARTLLGLYHYQNWKRMNEYTNDLAAARRELRAAVVCDSSNADVAFRYLVAGYARGDSIDAECERFIARFPALPEFRFMRGTLAFEARRYEACARDYAHAFDLLDDDTRAVYQSLTHVLAADDDERYRDASEEVQADFQRGLWLVSDSDPTTAVNPRFLEHTYRLFVADCLYSNAPTGKRGWATDRGEAFVRWGQPFHVDYSMGDGFATGKVETWSFITSGIFHRLVFVDEFLNGNPRIPYAADLTLFDMRYSPATTTLLPDEIEVPGAVETYAFRDEEMTTSIYLAMSVDADAWRASTDLSKVDRFVVRGAYFNDLWIREGGFSDSVRASDLRETRSKDGGAFEVVRRLRLPCDRYHLAIALETPDALARSVCRRDADASRFVGDGLVMSDVLLFRDDAGAAETAGTIERGGATMHPHVARRYANGERLRAYVEIYNLSLATRARTRESSYDLRFAIFPADQEDGLGWVDWGRRAAEWAGFGDDDDAVISQTFRRTGRAHHDSESMAINVDVLDPGCYELLVEAKDRRSGERAVVRTPFWKESNPVAEAKDRR